jgi:sugar transferase (PEP-CTERM system associated)
MFNGIRKRQVVLFTGDTFIFIISACIAALLRWGDLFTILINQPNVILITSLFYITFFYIFDLYNLSKHGDAWNVTIQILFAVITACGPIALLFYSVPVWKYGRGVWAIQMIITFLLAVAWHLIYSIIYSKMTRNVKVLVLGAGRAGQFLNKWLQESSIPYEIVGFLDDDPTKLRKSMSSAIVLGRTEQLIDIGKQIGVSTAINTVGHNKSIQLVKTIFEARLKGWTVLDMVKLYEENAGRVPVQHVSEEWFLFVEGFYLLSNTFTQKVKRLSDIALSLVLLLMIVPLSLITAVAIFIESGRPIFFNQTRIGKNGKTFRLWKFRSMRRNAEKEGAVWAQRNDPRITKVGSCIRLFRIDEIPQFWNVLIGDMSLIGPRPERPEFVAELEMQIPYYFVRHTIRPGITGWAQINYPYGNSVEDAKNKLEYELYYIKNMSFILDLRIMLKTIGVILSGKGAQ